MARITLEVDGVAEFDRTFKRMDAQFDDLTPIWDDVRNAFWEIEKEQFASEGAAGRYGKWQKLSDRYEAQKQKQYPGKPILERTGKLKSSLTGQTSDTVYQKDKKNMAVGTSLKYAGFHHRGAGKLPKRAIIAFSGKQKNYLQKEIQKGLVRDLRKGGIYVE